MGIFNNNKNENNIDVCQMRKKISDKFYQLNNFLDNNKCVQHIVLIDDDDTSNYVTEETLKSYGVGKKFSIFDNAEDALIFLKKMKNDGNIMPDMIFLDIKMPIMNGFEFLDKCKDFCNIEKDTKIVILSSSTYSKDKENVLKRGLEYITKPLQLENLKNYIEN